MSYNRLCLANLFSDVVLRRLRFLDAEGQMETNRNRSRRDTRRIPFGFIGVLALVLLGGRSHQASAAESLFCVDDFDRDIQRQSADEIRRLLYAQRLA